MQLYVKTIDMVVNFRDVDQCQRWVQAGACVNMEEVESIQTLHSFQYCIVVNHTVKMSDMDTAEIVWAGQG